MQLQTLSVVMLAGAGLRGQRKQRGMSRYSNPRTPTYVELRGENEVRRTLPPQRRKELGAILGDGDTRNWKRTGIT